VIGLLVGGVLALAGGYAAPAPDPGFARADPLCKPRGSTLVVASRQVRVWRIWHGVRSGYYACARERRRPVRLGDTDFTGGLHELVVAGRFVAYEIRYCDRGGQPICAGEVVVRDVGRRNVRRSPIPDGELDAVEVLVSSRGGAAWLRWLDGGASAEIRVLDSGGERVVASGPDIDLSSLAVTAGTVYWTQATIPRSAPLGHW
jgi:hypothetical protein